MRIASFVFIAATACSPYSPNLGQTPFLCGSADPKCPDGYTCESIGMDQVCVKNGTTAPDARDPNGMCTNDSQYETQNGANNDTIQTATVLQDKISDLMAAICPSGDKDYYMVQFTGTETLDVTLIYDLWGGVPQGEIDNAGGSRIGLLTPMMGADRTLHGAVNGLTAGMYYVFVQGPSGPGETRNNYELKVVVTP
jgi:hypothetical protein